MSPITPAQMAAKLERWAAIAPEAVKASLTRSAMLVENEAIKAHLSGPKMSRGVGSETKGTLARQTARLSKSIWHKVTVSRSKISARVGTNVKYAKIHEYGGTIRPKKGKYLAIPVGDYKDSPRNHDLVFARKAGGLPFLIEPKTGRVQYLLREKVVIPARSFLRPSLEKKREEVLENLLADFVKEYPLG